jgi:hypothetical protein
LPTPRRGEDTDPYHPFQLMARKQVQKEQGLPVNHALAKSHGKKATPANECLLNPLRATQPAGHLGGDAW